MPTLFDNYDPGDFFDEMFVGPGEVREDDVRCGGEPRKTPHADE